MKISKAYRKYSRQAISVLTALVLATGIILACADYSGFWELEDAVFFQPDVVDDSKSNELFYYTHNLLNTGYDGWGAQLSPDLLPEYDGNVEDWYQQLRYAVPKQDIDSFLNRSRDFVWTGAPDMKKFLSVYGSAPFIRHLAATNNKNALNYLLAAKSNEFGADRLSDGWNYFNSYDYYRDDSLNVQQPSSHDAVTDLIIKGLHSTRDEFYKQRYAYQLIRRFRYTHHNTGVDSLFLLYFTTAPHSHLYYYAMNYATDGLVNSSEQAKANYYASVLFHSFYEKKYRSYENFSNKIPIDSVLKYCASDKERSMVYSMYAFRDFYPNSYYITRAVELDPDNAAVSDLIIREINKVDMRLLPEYSSYYWWPEQDEASGRPNIMDEDGNVIRVYPEESDSYNNLEDLLHKLSIIHAKNKQFYTLCLAHIALQQHNNPSAYRYLGMIREAELTPKLNAQYHLTKVLLHIRAQNLRDPQQQQILHNELQYIESNRELYYRKDFVIQGVLLIASKKLLHDHDYARAYLVSKGLTDMYGDYDVLHNDARPEDIDTILGIIAHPLNDFDKKITGYNTLSKDELRDIQGSLYVRANRMDMALKSFSAVDDTYIPVNFKTLNTNPDGHPFYPYNYELITDSPSEWISAEEIRFHNERARQLRFEYNNYSIVKEINDLQKKIRLKQGDLATLYFNLASLYFELTYHGRAYEVIDYNNTWSMGEMEYMEYRKKRPGYWKHYYACEWSVPYYQLALKYSKNRELSAKCLYALFRCNRYRQIYYAQKDGKEDLAYLFRLHDKYANTQYYHIKECWGLSAYVSALRGGVAGNQEFR